MSLHFGLSFEALNHLLEQRYYVSPVGTIGDEIAPTFLLAEWEKQQHEADFPIRTRLVFVEHRIDGGCQPVHLLAIPYIDWSVT
jgi:hypothetical protein